MNKKIKYAAPWLSAAAIGAAIALAPIASAAPATSPVSQYKIAANPAPSPNPQVGESGPNPLVPYGTNPAIPYQLGFYNPNISDDSGTTNPAGGVDLAG